ncbi:MAG: segregation/condensation protein A [Desulfobacterales bacterium]|nr:segregation/condensation protein A [Desulfobacterales bacterium]
MMVSNDSSSVGNAPYTVRLEMFEGPLDLLLHLIHKNELDITNIPIALITEQYLEYLKLMKVLNLDMAGEYLLMASTLLYIKSKMLLPASSEEGEEEGEDPRAELVRRLLEYQKYKEAAAELEKRPMLDRDVFLRSTPMEVEDAGEEERVEVNLFELIEAFRKILERVKTEEFHEVILDRLSVEEKAQEIFSLLQREKRSMAFHLLFPEQASRRVIIITFLAILELVKMKLVRVFQLTPFETIRISLV